MTAIAEPLAFEILAEAAEDNGLGGEDVAIGGEGMLLTILLLPGGPNQVGMHFTLDLFAAIQDPRALVHGIVNRMTLEALASSSLVTIAEDELLDRIQELVPYLRHSPGCQAEKPGSDESACLCSLSATLDGLRDDHGIDVTRCHGCGQQAITPDGTEDWAWMTAVVAPVDQIAGDQPPESPSPIPYCHSCAVAAGA